MYRGDEEPMTDPARHSTMRDAFERTFKASEILEGTISELRNALEPISIDRSTEAALKQPGSDESVDVSPKRSDHVQSIHNIADNTEDAVRRLKNIIRDLEV